MPLVSQAQRRWMHATHPAMAEEWEAHTPKGKKLPEHVSKKKASLMDKLAAATTLRDRLVLVTKLAAVKAARCGKLVAARKMAKYAQSLEQGNSISKAASAAGMSFKEGAVIYSVMMHRIKQAEPGVMSPKGPSTSAGPGGLGGAGAKMQQAGQAGMQMAAGKGPGLQRALMAPAAAVMQGAGRMMQGFGGRPGTAAPSVPGAPGGMKRADMAMSAPPTPAAPSAGQGGGFMSQLQGNLPMLAALGLIGGGGALVGAGMRPKQPVRGAVEGVPMGFGAAAGGAAGAGLGGMAGLSLAQVLQSPALVGQAGNGQLTGASPLAGMGAMGAMAGGLAGAVGGGYLGHMMGRGANNLTGGAPEDQQEEMAADSL